MKGVDFQRELIPPGNLLFQPVAIGAAVEVIRRGGSEPSMERVALATPRVNPPSADNVSERRTNEASVPGLEKGNVRADPPESWGRPTSRRSGPLTLGLVGVSN